MGKYIEVFVAFDVAKKKHGCRRAVVSGLQKQKNDPLKQGLA